jgi:hypothetical protein
MSKEVIKISRELNDRIIEDMQLKKEVIKQTISKVLELVEEQVKAEENKCKANGHDDYECMECYSDGNEYCDAKNCLEELKQKIEEME